MSGSWSPIWPKEGSPETIYAELYCARGQAENLIKLHKTQLASDRTSCRSPLANQMRLILHTAAYWLMLTIRDAIPTNSPLAKAEFTTIRTHLIKLGAHIQETASRIKIAFAAACPQAALFRQLASTVVPAAPLATGPKRPGRVPSTQPSTKIAKPTKPTNRAGR